MGRLVFKVVERGPLSDLPTDIISQKTQMSFIESGRKKFEITQYFEKTDLK